MVLISHIYKFIYLKNYKVAGSSIESFFGQYCIDPAKRSQYSFKDKQDEQISSYGILGHRLGGQNTIWHNHKSAKEIYSALGPDIFNEYYKFCVVRNPYDLMVSSYHWQKTPKSFKTYCSEYNISNNNLDRILIDDVPICQYYIRYENLITDVLKVLKDLGVTDYNINDIPHHKSSSRTHDKSYREYYDEETKEIVRKIFQREIEMFGYEF